MKKCPYCSEDIQDEAIFCRWCEHDLLEKVNKETVGGYKSALPITTTKDKKPWGVFWRALLLGIGTGLIVYNYRLKQSGNFNDAFLGGLSCVFIYGGMYSFVVWIKRAFIKRNKSVSRFSKETGCASLVFFFLFFIAFAIYVMN